MNSPGLSGTLPDTEQIFRSPVWVAKSPGQNRLWVSWNIKCFGFFVFYRLRLERFSIECRKTKTKVIIGTPTNHISLALY